MFYSCLSATERYTKEKAQHFPQLHHNRFGFGSHYDVLCLSLSLCILYKRHICTVYFGGFIRLFLVKRRSIVIALP